MLQKYGYILVSMTMLTLPMVTYAETVKLVCPKGTTLDKAESTPTKMVCDVDSDPTKDESKDLDIYPLPAGEPPYVVHEDDFPKRVNKSYPDWYRGSSDGYMAADDSFHFYYSLIGPGVAAPGYDTKNLFCASFYLKPEKTYFAHNHPSREFYYVIEGEGRWYAGDEEFDVKGGAFIVHPPYLSHGFKNTSKTNNLRAFTCWWRTPDQPEDVLTYHGLPTNPCLVEKEKTAKPYAVPSVCEK